MDFFSNQERARRNTSILIFFYLVAVVLIIVSVYGVFAWLGLGQLRGEDNLPLKGLERWWNTELFLWVGGITIAIVAFGTISKIAQLAAGGATVASMLGGRKIDPGTNDAGERKILNVVSEMSIASGVPAPPVYIMDEEPGINAFAAGFSTRDAVIGVTRGAVEDLNRDQLQGVIAHEFSHMLNGDMRLNIKLIGVLNGILVIALVGYWLMALSSRSRDNKGNNMPIVVAGLLLMVVGYIGVFFGNVIKAAISRQREFNADAEAVQFTRNPDGIAGALKKIGKIGSNIQSTRGEEVSHMLFSSGVSGFLSGLFATHPPLEERIERITGIPVESSEKNVGTTDSGCHSEAAISGFAAGTARTVTPERTTAMIGTVSPEHNEFASEMLKQLPRNLTETVSNPETAATVIYALLLAYGTGDEIRRTQEEGLKTMLGSELFNSVSLAANDVATLWPGYRLPLANMAISTLKGINQKGYERFNTIINFLIQADHQTDLFEYMIVRLAHTYLAPGCNHRRGVKHCSKNDARLACAELLSCLAVLGTNSADAATAAFAKGMCVFGDASPMSNDCDIAMLDRAIEYFVDAPPLLKRAVIESCTAVIAADDYVTIEEAELLRAVAAALDCPMPPLFPGKKPSITAA